MPKLKLTKANIDKITSPERGQVDYFDTDDKGFALRVSCDYMDKKAGAKMKGARTFFVQLDVKDTSKKKGYKTVRKTLGRYGDLTPEEARKRVKGFHDKQGEFVPGMRLEIKTGAATDNGIKVSLRDLYNRYLKDKPLAKTTLLLYKSYIPSKFESWLDLSLPELATILTPETVIDRYQQLREASGSGAAHNAFKCLQSIINYGSILYPQYITRNPVKVLSDAKLWGERQAREDCLEAGQFKAFYDGLLQFTPIHRDAFFFALYQGLRPNEAQSIRWEDIDLEKKTAFIRHETEHSKRSYTIPLSKQTMEIMKRRNEAREEGNPFVFPSDWRTNKRGHVTLRAEKLKERTGLDLTVHGLRRTFITTGERLRLRREDINLLTGHIDSSVTGKHYNRITIDDLRPTLKRIADEVERLMVEGVGGKVIQLPTAISE
ncbi:MAG TPA: integrase family protein [Geobacteraceae bacterium]|nr:integrase family protein [Geobacteraceae bacterium]